MVTTVEPEALKAARIVQDFDRLAVDMDDAGAAIRCVATDMGACKPQIFPQEMDEQRAVLDGRAHLSAIHG